MACLSARKLSETLYSKVTSDSFFPEKLEVKEVSLPVMYITHFYGRVGGGSRMVSFAQTGFAGC